MTLAQVDDGCFVAIDDAMRTERFPLARALLVHLMQVPDFGDLPVMVNMLEDDLDGVYSPISFTLAMATCHRNELVPFILTVAAAVGQSSFAPATALIQSWMTDPARQGGDTLLLPCKSVSLRYGAPRRMPRPAPPMH